MKFNLVDLLLNPDNIANSEDNELACTSIEEVQDFLPSPSPCEDADEEIIKAITHYHEYYGAIL